MGFFSGLLGGLFGGGGGEAEEYYIDPKQSLEDTREYWNQYHQMLSDVTQSFKSEEEQLATMKAFGRIPESAYQNRLKDLNERKELELDTVRNGSTAQILKEEYNFQRQEAMKAHDREYQSALTKAITDAGGSGGSPSWEGYQEPVYAREAIGNPSQEGYQEAVVDREAIGNPSQEGYQPAINTYKPPAKSEFNFAKDFETFYRDNFGDVEVKEFDRGGSGAGSPSRKAAAAGGLTQGRAVGVGRTYSFY